MAAIFRGRLAEPAPDIGIRPGISEVGGVASIDRLEADVHTLEHDRGGSVAEAVHYDLKFGS